MQLLHYVVLILSTLLPTRAIVKHTNRPRRFLQRDLSINNNRHTSNDLTSNLAKCFVIISNLQSGSNIGAIFRNSRAFNVHEVIVVGRKNFRDKMRHADRGAKELQAVKHFNSIAEARDYLKLEQNATIIGIEIMESAVSLTKQTFCGHTAFMFGNEGGGLSDRQREACDSFVYIPQYASGGIASINVACASAIVLQTFAVWAGYSETLREKEKFI
jgi:tRNA G18 (ribose-2'-O)-methylase SpoU